MAKFRTRNYDREINPFTDEPWRTPGEFIGDALANAEANRLNRLEKRQAKRKLKYMSSKDIDRLAKLAELLEDDDDE
jgi:hypothetical protein